jgi:hypothetical protein
MLPAASYVTEVIRRVSGLLGGLLADQARQGIILEVALLRTLCDFHQVVQRVIHVRRFLGW